MSDYNDHIARLQEQRDSVAREVEAMREDQNYRFREYERRTNAENASRSSTKSSEVSPYYDPDLVASYSKIGLQTGEQNKNKKESSVADMIVLLVFIIIVGLAISTFVR